MTMYQANPLIGKSQHEIMAEILMQRALQPQGDNKTMAPGITALANGLMAGKMRRDAQAQQKTDSADLARAMQIGTGGTENGINWQPNQAGMMQELAKNERLAPMATQLMYGDMQSQRDLQNEIAKAKALQPLEIEKAMAIAKAKSEGSGSKVMADAIQLSEQLGIDIGTAYSIAKSGVGVGNAVNRGGKVSSMSGYVPAIAEQAGAKKDAVNQSDLNYKPQIEEKTSEFGIVGKDKGEKKAALSEREAMLPRLEQVVDDLGELGEKATYTYGGQAIDLAARQLGLPVPEGAVARTEYISKVDNEILPLLRQTFGAQFTEREGQSLKATLGDPNKSPEEKKAVLRSFIDQKRAQIGVLRSEVGASPQVQPKQRMKYNPETGELE